MGIEHALDGISRYYEITRSGFDNGGWTKLPTIKLSKIFKPKKVKKPTPSIESRMELDLEKKQKDMFKEVIGIVEKDIKPSITIEEAKGVPVCGDGCCHDDCIGITVNGEYEVFAINYKDNKHEVQDMINFISERLGLNK